MTDCLSPQLAMQPFSGRPPPQPKARPLLRLRRTPRVPLEPPECPGAPLLELKAFLTLKQKFRLRARPRVLDVVYTIGVRCFNRCAFFQGAGLSYIGSTLQSPPWKESFELGTAAEQLENPIHLANTSRIKNADLKKKKRHFGDLFPLLF